MGEAMGDPAVDNPADAAEVREETALLTLERDVREFYDALGRYTDAKAAAISGALEFAGMLAKAIGEPCRLKASYVIERDPSTGVHLLGGAAPDGAAAQVLFKDSLPLDHAYGLAEQLRGGLLRSTAAFFREQTGRAQHATATFDEVGAALSGPADAPDE